ncbi:MAG: aspartyl protease family protein [Bacteroidetes bacterium]|nr:aspartyl protease family protein [Bacteroidota bacterium]
MKTKLPVCFAVFLWVNCLCLPSDVCAATPPRLVFTEASWLGPNIVRIPFTFTGTLITVRARLDTLEGNFFFDTGASTLVLNNRFLKRSNAAATENRGSVTGKVQLVGAMSVDSFQLDELIISNIQADVVDLSHIERSKKIALMGIIGYEVFKDFEILYDYNARLLVLVRLDQKGNQLERIPDWEYALLQSIPIRVEGHFALLDLEFEGNKKKQFGLDTGAEQNLLSSESGGRFLKANFEIRKRVRLGGVGQEKIEVLSGLLQHAHVDSFQFRPMATLLTNLNDINAVNQTYMDGILGYEFFVQYPMSINYRKKRLTFYRILR